MTELAAMGTPAHVLMKHAGHKKITTTMKYYLGDDDISMKKLVANVNKLTPGSKKMTVKWKKQATQTTGYQIQYSQSSKFTKSKTVTVKKNTATSTTIKKLSAKKKYYARIRTYKTVKVNGKATKLYSSWSKAKSVTVKK